MRCNLGSSSVERLRKRAECIHLKPKVSRIGINKINKLNKRYATWWTALNLQASKERKLLVFLRERPKKYNSPANTFNSNLSYSFEEMSHESVRIYYHRLKVLKQPRKKAYCNRRNKNQAGEKVNLCMGCNRLIRRNA